MNLSIILSPCRMRFSFVRCTYWINAVEKLIYDAFCQKWIYGLSVANGWTKKKFHDFYTIHYILCFLFPICEWFQAEVFFILVTRVHHLFSLSIFTIFMSRFRFSVIIRTLLFAKAHRPPRLYSQWNDAKKVHQINVEHIVKCSRMQKTWRAHEVR